MKSFGKYQVVKELGKGAMGVVYLGYDSVLERSVAIKTISSSMQEDTLRARFVREAQSTGKLHHNNIVTIYDFGTEGEDLFIVMEYLEGQDLERIISLKADMDIRERLSIIRQLCLGLDYAHKNGILHRDIKPANIFVLKDGSVKIVDFGLAAMHSSTLTKSNAVLGTPHYIAPERIQGTKASGRSDQFSTGIILYELLTYERAFTGDTISSIIYQILNREPKHLDPKIALRFPELEYIIKRSIAKNPELRYETMGDMGEDIEKLRERMKTENFSMSSAIKTTDELMLPVDDSETYETVIKTSPAVLSASDSKKFLKTLRWALPTLIIAALLIYFISHAIRENHRDHATTGRVNRNVNPSVNAGLVNPGEDSLKKKDVYRCTLSIDIKPYAEIKLVKNLDSGEVIPLPGTDTMTPLSLNLDPGQYEIQYTIPLRPELKMIVKKVMVIAGRMNIFTDIAERGFAEDAAKHFKLPEYM